MNQFGPLVFLLIVSVGFNIAVFLSSASADDSECLPTNGNAAATECSEEGLAVPPPQPVKYERVAPTPYHSGAEAKCDSEFGWGVLNKIRSAEKLLCDGPVSTVRCAPFSWDGRNDWHARHGSFCQLTNVALVGSKIVPMNEHYDEAGQPDVRPGEFVFEDWQAWFPKGSVVVAGSPGCDSSLFSKPRHINRTTAVPPPEPGTIPLAGPLAPMFYNGLSNQDSLPHCDIWFEEPFIAVGRREANSHMLFGVAEGINALVTAKAFLSPEELGRMGILYLDITPLGFTEEFFRAVVKGGPIVHMLDYMGNQSKTLCFKKLLTSQFAYSNFLVHRAMSDGEYCRNSPILKEFRDRVTSYLNISVQPYPETPTALFISRRFDFKPDMARVIVNEKEIVDSVKKEVDAGKLVFDVVQMEKVSLREQLALDQSHNILVGPHGMGMAHLLFLPDDSVVLEIWPRGYNKNTRHRNIARLLGHSYLGYEVPGRNKTAMHADAGVFRDMMDRAVHIVRSSFGNSVERCGFVCPSNCSCQDDTTE